MAVRMPSGVSREPLAGSLDLWAAGAAPVGGGVGFGSDVVSGADVVEDEGHRVAGPGPWPDSGTPVRAARRGGW